MCAPKSSSQIVTKPNLDTSQEYYYTLSWHPQTQKENLASARMHCFHICNNDQWAKKVPSEGKEWTENIPPKKKKWFLGRIERKRTTPTYEEHHRHEIRLRVPSLWRANPGSLHTHATWPRTRILTPPTHSCSILSFLKPQQNFTRLYLFYQSCKSFFTPFYWINGKKMTSSSHTNLATWTISEPHICKPQKQQKWHVSLFLSFSLSLTIFRVLRWYIAPSLESLLHFLHFHWILLLWVSTQFATSLMKWCDFESFEWVVCLTQNFPWRRCHACMHAWIHARNWIKNMSSLKSHLNVPTMNNCIWTYQLWTIAFECTNYEQSFVESG
jgi:hypothetical protein